MIRVCCISFSVQISTLIYRRPEENRKYCCCFCCVGIDSGVVFIIISGIITADFVVVVVVVVDVFVDIDADVGVRVSVSVLIVFVLLLR